MRGLARARTRARWGTGASVRGGGTGERARSNIINTPSNFFYKIYTPPSSSSGSSEVILG